MQDKCFGVYEWLDGDITSLALESSKKTNEVGLIFTIVRNISDTSR